MSSLRAEEALDLDCAELVLVLRREELASVRTSECRNVQARPRQSPGFASSCS